MIIRWFESRANHERYGGLPTPSTVARNGKSLSIRRNRVAVHKELSQAVSRIGEPRSPKQISCKINMLARLFSLAVGYFRSGRIHIVRKKYPWFFRIYEICKDDVAPQVVPVSEQQHHHRPSASPSSSSSFSPVLITLKIPRTRLNSNNNNNNNPIPSPDDAQDPDHEDKFDKPIVQERGTQKEPISRPWSPDDDDMNEPLAQEGQRQELTPRSRSPSDDSLLKAHGRERGAKEPKPTLPYSDNKDKTRDQERWRQELSPRSWSPNNDNGGLNKTPTQERHRLRQGLEPRPGLLNDDNPDEARDQERERQELCPKSWPSSNNNERQSLEQEPGSRQPWPPSNDDNLDKTQDHERERQEESRRTSWPMFIEDLSSGETNHQPLSVLLSKPPDKRLVRAFERFEKEQTRRAQEKEQTERIRLQYEHIRELKRLEYEHQREIARLQQRQHSRRRRKKDGTTTRTSSRSSGTHVRKEPTTYQQDQREE